MVSDFFLNVLYYHIFPLKGKLFIKNIKSLSFKKDLLLSYTPGVAYVSKLIYNDYYNSYKYTSKSNLVIVLTNGTAILGLGNLGVLSSKPVMEGKSVLFKKFSNIDSYDIELKQNNVNFFINTVLSIEDTISGINLEDIKSPKCFYIEKFLLKFSKIPIFHDDQHGTAIVVCSFIINSLRYLGKSIFDVKLVCLGAGAASISCLNLLIKIGFCKNNIFVFDSNGLLNYKRQNLNIFKRKFVVYNDFCFLNNFYINFDIFLGCSVSNILSFKILKIMNLNPIILTLSNPNPEIIPEISKFVRSDAILATGRSDYKNQVNNLICYPYFFRVLLDNIIINIIDFLKIKCIFLISDLIFNNYLEKYYFINNFYLKEFSKFYLISDYYDYRLIIKIPVFISNFSTCLGLNNFYLKNYFFYLKKLSLINLR